ncbi:hypothetical protein LJC06_03700, partial [Bacteroidales bacterium OttesenSCG-928-I14]|nr:hypothetical protein [Bacteroidales bacterium OttesenSCG-928-I14]
MLHTISSSSRYTSTLRVDVQVLLEFVYIYSKSSYIGTHHIKATTDRSMPDYAGIEIRASKAPYPQNPVSVHT